MTVLIGILWIAFGVYVLAVGPMGGAEGCVFAIVIGSMSITAGASGFWWNRVVQFRKEGVLRGLKLLRWSHITKHSWYGTTVILEGVDQRHQDTQLEAVAEFANRDELAQFIDRKLASHDWFARHGGEGASNWQARAMLVPIRPRQSITLRGVFAAFLAYYVFTMLVFVVFRTRPGLSREFVHGAFFGFGVAGVKLAFDSWRAGVAGAPLVRISTAIDWPSAFVAVAVIVGAALIHQRILFPSAWIAIPLGFIASIAACVLAGILLRDKLDLCENGIVLVRWPFLPWSRVHALKWDRDGTRPLLLRSGWRRIKGKVPPGHRAAVDRVLQANVGNSLMRADPKAGSIPSAPTQIVTSDG
jgi:hypothetical protein